MRQQAITVANLTPAMPQVLCDQYKSGEDIIGSLRFSFLVGDILRQRDVLRLKQLAPSITCVNLFGATETQRAVSYYVPSAANEDTLSRQVLPLGKGIKDVSCWS